MPRPLRLLESNERMCKQMGRGNNTKIQWPIICFYITRHFSLTFDSYALDSFFCVSFEMNEISSGPGRDRIHLSKSIRATRSGQSGNLSYSGRNCRRTRPKLEKAKLCCPRNKLTSSTGQQINAYCAVSWAALKGLICIDVEVVKLDRTEWLPK